MKYTGLLVMAFILFSACSSTKEMTDNKTNNKKNKKQAEIADIKKAIEARRFVIKVDRLYTSEGRRFDLVPTNNFLIVNGEIASISLGYVGKSYTSRPISGINLNSHTEDYIMESDESKGIYKIQMEVQYSGDRFRVYLTVGNTGDCSITMNNARIDNVSYSGNLVPLSGSKMTGDTAKESK